MHPAPFVTHPYLYVAQAAFVVSVVAARLQAFTEHGGDELIMHPTSHVSLHVASIKTYSHVLSAHFVASIVAEKEHNVPEVFLLKAHASNDVKL